MFSFSKNKSEKFPRDSWRDPSFGSVFKENHINEYRFDTIDNFCMNCKKPEQDECKCQEKVQPKSASTENYPWPTETSRSSCVKENQPFGSILKEISIFKQKDDSSNSRSNNEKKIVPSKEDCRVIVLKIRKPKAIMMDFAGTMAKTGFISKIVFGYIRANVATYLSNNWGNRILMRDIDLLRAESQRDGGPIVFGSNESAEKIRESAASYVVRCHDEQRNSEAIRIFRFHMLFNGYRHKKVTTAIYSDVAEGLGEWASREHIEIFVYSNCWKYACKFMLQHTNHSDLSLLISDYFDTELGPLNDPKSYEKIVHKLGYPSQDILFLTKSGEEGKAAHMAGLSVVLVETHREDVDREVTNEITKLDLPFVRILSSLEFAADAPTASSLGSSSSCPTTWSTNHCSTATSGTSSGRGSSSTALSGSRAPPGRKSAPQSSKGSATRLSGGSRSSATRLSSGSRSSATRLSTSGASRTHSSGMLASSNKGSSSASATQISSGSASRGSSAPSSGGGGGASSSHGSSTRLSGGSSRGSATQLSGSAPRGSATQLSGSSSRGSATQISGSSSRGSATQISGSSSRGSSHQTSSGGGGSSSSAHSRSTHSR